MVDGAGSLPACSSEAQNPLNRRTLPTVRRTSFAFSVFLVLGCGGHRLMPPSEPVRRPTGEVSRVDIAYGDMREVLIQLARVHFGRDSAEITPQAREALERAAAILSDHRDVFLVIEGHADNRGTPEYNLALGQRRADAVFGVLTSLGVAAGRLESVSFGEERPLADPRTGDGLARNRRVDFRLVQGTVRLVLDEGELVGARARLRP